MKPIKIIFYLLKMFILGIFKKQKKKYTLDNLYELNGTKLQYVSTDLCMPVYIAQISKEGISLAGRWYDKYDKKYEDKDSLIFCINNKNHIAANTFNEKIYLEKINYVVNTGVLFFNNATIKNSYFLSTIDHLCAFK